MPHLSWSVLPHCLEIFPLFKFDSLPLPPPPPSLQGSWILLLITSLVWFPQMAINWILWQQVLFWVLGWRGAQKESGSEPATLSSALPCPVADWLLDLSHVKTSPSLSCSSGLWGWSLPWFGFKIFPQWSIKTLILSVMGTIGKG
jgi:hypothetical protein